MTFAGARILILEDEPIIGLALEDMLERQGAHVLFASGIEEASELIAAEQIDSAILDVNVHGLQSYPIASLLAERAVPYIFATGYGDAGLRDVDKGSPVLQKPFRETDLARVLGELRASAGA